MSQLYSVSDDSSVWYQKHRPHTIADCVLPQDTKQWANAIVSSGIVPSILLVGSPGTGKTTLAMALAHELNASVMVINASLDANLELIRTSIQQFASTVSLTNSSQVKIVILDELDQAPPTFQPALRSFMETFSNNVSFIITANYKNKIIDAIKSRCQVVEFNITNENKPKLAAQFFKMVCGILQKEGIDYDKTAVAELVTKKFPDFRSTLNTLQMYAASGQIDIGVLSKQFESDFNELFDHIKAKNFTDMRRWLAEHPNVSSADLTRGLFDQLSPLLRTEAKAELVLILGKYQYQAAFVADKEINDCAMLTEIMINCEM